MTFPSKEINRLLVQCHRRCCVCHRFCGIKIEIDHIVPKSQGGEDIIENAMPVCFECHAEIHLYNDKHPRGRKFTPDELRKHKEQWLSICAEKPEALVDALRNGDVGPLQALVDELDFNCHVSNRKFGLGCQFETTQFNRTISEGLLSLLPDDVRNSLIEAYARMKRANLSLLALAQTRPEGNAYGVASNSAQAAVIESDIPTDHAHTALAAYLASETRQEK